VPPASQTARPSASHVRDICRHLPPANPFSGTKPFHNTLQIGKYTREAEPKKDEGMLTPNLSFLINGTVAWIIRTPNGLTV
jgi:hypothetical protein